MTNFIKYFQKMHFLYTPLKRVFDLIIYTLILLMSISDLKLSNTDLLKYAEKCQSAWIFLDEYLSSPWHWDGLHRELYIQKSEHIKFSSNIPPYTYFSTNEYTFFFYKDLPYKSQKYIFATEKNNVIIVVSNKNETKQ